VELQMILVKFSRYCDVMVQSVADKSSDACGELRGLFVVHGGVSRPSQTWLNHGMMVTVMI